MKNLFLILIMVPILAFSQSDFEKAEKLFKQQKYSQAQVLFESVLKQNPTNLKTIEYLGDIHGGAKNWSQALIYYDKLKKIKPSEANFHYKYGGVLGMLAKESNKFKALGLIDDIKLSFEKAIQLNPKHIEARWALVELYLILPGIVGGSERKAKRYSEELAQLSPIDGYLSKGHIAEYFNRYKEAEMQYKKAIEIGTSKISYQKLADLYKNKMKQPEKAKSILQDFERQKG
jgi:tetratricopeptide (TPR) repeat protein